MVVVERVQTGVRLEKRLLKTTKALAEVLDLSLGDLLEGVLLHVFEGDMPFSDATLAKIETLRSVFGLTLTAEDAHRLHGDEPELSELDRFRSGELDAGSFGHAEHVRMAFLSLQEEPFTATLPRFATAIQTMATRAGRPDHYNATITTAFLSLIAERMAGSPGQTFEEFRDANADLLEADAISRRYSPERLGSPLARSTFLLPDV